MKFDRPLNTSLHIVGCGAIGCLIAAGAARNKIPYCLYPRRKEPLPIYVKSMMGDVTLSNFASHPVKLSSDDVLFLPVKAYQVKEALEQWSRHLSTDTPVVLMHNGMGGSEVARKILPPEQPIVIATTRHGALKANATSVHHTGQGLTDIGTLDTLNLPDAIKSKFVSIFTALFGDIVWHDNMALPLWTKLAINAVINPLTAIHNIRNGELTQPQYAYIIQQLCKETSEVAKSEGVPLSCKTLIELVLNVASDTASNYSSMHQDIHNGRRSEVGAINGYIVDIANKNGMSATHHADLLNKVTLLGNA